MIDGRVVSRILEYTNILYSVVFQKYKKNSLTFNRLFSLMTVGDGPNMMDANNKTFYYITRFSFFSTLFVYFVIL